jgi:hypothetical protein
MKFLCKDEFMHSGDRIYTAGTVYDLSEETVNKLITVDKQRLGGALRFFTPVDEAAAACMRAIHNGLNHAPRHEPEPKGVGVPKDTAAPKVTPPTITLPARPITPPAPPTAPAPAAPPADTPAQLAQPPSQPSRETLVKEAKSLGLKVPFGISNNDLMLLITAARQRLPPQE